MLKEMDHIYIYKIIKINKRKITKNNPKVNNLYKLYKLLSNINIYKCHQIIIVIMVNI